MFDDFPDPMDKIGDARRDFSSSEYFVGSFRKVVEHYARKYRENRN